MPRVPILRPPLPSLGYRFVLVCFAALLLVGLALFPTQSHTQSDPPVPIVTNGVPDATIYVQGPLLSEAEVQGALGTPDRMTLPPADGSDIPYVAHDLSRSAAAHELNTHLRKMTGSALPVQIVTDAADITGPAIILGALANAAGAEPQAASPSREGFRILATGDRILIGAESDLGLRHGAYELLRQLGVDWVMPGEIGEIIPQSSTIALPAMDLAQAPDFQFRRLWYRGFRPRSPAASQRYGLWQWRHKGGGPRHLVESTAGHTWQRILKAHQAEFDADPTMLALVRDSDGSFVRRGPQLETTHPRVIALFADQIRQTYEQNIAAGRWTKDTAAGFPIGPADGLGYSQSAEAILAGSGRMDAVIGVPDQTDQMILFANRILDAVTDDYPNAHVGYYAYSAHADYPLRYRPHPNVTQIFAPINFSRFHGVTDLVSKGRSHYRDSFEKWAALSFEQGNLLAYRGYNWNLADNLLPYSKIAIWGRDLPFYAVHNVIGLNVEATKQWSVLAPSDYVFMRMAWDTSQDWWQLLSDFTQSAYGAAAPPMFRYWMRLTEQQRAAGMEAGSYHAFPLIYDLEWVAAAEADIAEALSLARTDDDRTRIGFAAIGLDFLRLYLEFHEATRAFDFDEAARHYQAILDRWQNAYDTNEDLVANEAPRYLERFFGLFVEEARAYSSDPFRIVARLPDQMKTAFDPYGQGERLGYHLPEIVDDQFLMTRTISSTWDAQGVSGLRDGAVWYRWRFDLPDDHGDAPLALFLGGFEDSAAVWLNGVKLGTSRPTFNSPVVFDLGPAINAEGGNLLAIQITRTRKFNEIGLGGVLQPSFLFTGPE